MSESGERNAVDQSRKCEEIGLSIFAYQLGHIGFIDLIHQLDEMLGIPHLELSQDQKEVSPDDPRTA